MHTIRPGPGVETQCRLNTSTLSTLNKWPMSAQVFKVGAARTETVAQRAVTDRAADPGGMAVRDPVGKHRQRMRARGYRPVQVWVPDVRTEQFAKEARRQAELIARRDRQGDDQDSIEAVDRPWDEE